MAALCGLAIGAVAAPPPPSTHPPVKLALIEGLSGPFANAGEAVWRNLQWGVERVNARGGVKLADGMHPLELLRLDSKGNTDEALNQLKSATDQGVTVVMQGNSSSVAKALVDALNKHNSREPDRRAVFLNYSAVEPSLTNENCSFWHFRFDATADMRLQALTSVMAGDSRIDKVYLIGQDYSFGQYVVRRGAEMLKAQRADLQVVGSELHPVGRIKDFLPYASKIRASGAQAVVTGNWGNDLTLLVKSVRDLGLDAKFYTFYGNALGVPGTLQDAGVGRVYAVAEWLPNVDDEASRWMVQAFRQRFPRPEEDYLHARMQLMVEMLASALEKAGSADATRVAYALEGMRYDGEHLHQVHRGEMRAADHQFLQPLYVSVMDKAGSASVPFDVEGSGYGFRVVRRFPAAELTADHSACRMQRPGRPG